MHTFRELAGEMDFRILIVVYLSFLMDNILLTVVVPIIPDYLFSTWNDTQLESVLPKSLSPLQRKFKHLDEENGKIGTLLASKAFIQLIFTPIFGCVSKTIGYGKPLLIGSICMCFACILFAYGNAYILLVIARGLHGISSAAIYVSGMSLLAEEIPIHVRSRVMPIAFGGIAVGVLIGYPLGGGAYQLFGKSAPFLLIAFCILINIGLQLSFGMGESRRGGYQIQNGIDKETILGNPQTLIATGAIFICTSCMSIIEPCVPIWLLGHLNPPPSKWQLGAIFIPDSVGYFIGSHTAGFIPFITWRSAVIAMVLIGISCISLPNVTSIQDLTLPHFGIGLGVGAIDAIMVPFLANLVHDQENAHYGTIYAVQQAAVSLAYLFGPLMGGLLVPVIGFSWLMRLVAFMNLLYCPILSELGNI